MEESFSSFLVSPLATVFSQVDIRICIPHSNEGKATCLRKLAHTKHLFIGLDINFFFWHCTSENDIRLDPYSLLQLEKTVAEKRGLMSNMTGLCP